MNLVAGERQRWRRQKVTWQYRFTVSYYVCGCLTNTCHLKTDGEIRQLLGYISMLKPTSQLGYELQYHLKPSVLMFKAVAWLHGCDRNGMRKMSWDSAAPEMILYNAIARASQIESSAPAIMAPLPLFRMNNTKIVYVCCLKSFSFGFCLLRRASGV